MRNDAVRTKPKGSVAQRLTAAGLVGLSLAYLFTFVARGWVPHDEGMIGQSAEQVLAGAVPHVDYQEPYTGGLTWLHARLFKVAGVDLVYPRWLLFGGAAVAQAVTYLILRRWLTPVPAAVGAWVALAWSFPNYFAAIPSWWVLVCALAVVWAFIKYVETRLLRYAVTAGLAAGVSILIKQTGVYLLVALVIAILYGGIWREQQPRMWWLGRLVGVTVAVATIALAFALMAARLTLSDLLYLFLPILACSRVLATADGRDPLLRGGQGLIVPAAALAAAAVPLVVFIAPYALDGQLQQLVTGLFILPQKRRQFAAFDMPPAYWIAAGVPLVAVLMLPRGRPAALMTRKVGIALGVTGSILLAMSLSNGAAYQVLWQSVRALAALLPVAAGWLLVSGQGGDANDRWILFGCVTMLAWASLGQIPFSAPIYFCYVTPLAVIATAAVAGQGVAVPRPALAAVATVVLLFALVIMNRGYIYNLGVSHQRVPLNVPLDLERAHLAASAADAVNYRRVLDLIDAHIGNGRLIAGPDCPEVYFLTGSVSPSGMLFDFFGDHVSAEGWVTDLPGWQTASVVVLNHGRRFSRGPSLELVARVRKEFPHAEAAGPLEVRWR